MSAVLFLATIVVAFIAGIVALAMPCCFTVLLPSYLAKSFGTVAGRLGMTAVFGAGIATVLLPIAMGLSFVTTFITANLYLFTGVAGSVGAAVVGDLAESSSSTTLGLLVAAGFLTLGGLLYLLPGIRRLVF